MFRLKFIPFFYSQNRLNLWIQETNVLNWKSTAAHFGHSSSDWIMTIFIFFFKFYLNKYWPIGSIWAMDVSHQINQVNNSPVAVIYEIYAFQSLTTYEIKTILYLIKVSFRRFNQWTPFKVFALCNRIISVHLKLWATNCAWERRNQTHLQLKPYCYFSNEFEIKHFMQTCCHFNKLCSLRECQLWICLYLRKQCAVSGIF